MAISFKEALETIKRCRKDLDKLNAAIAKETRAALGETTDRLLKDLQAATEGDAKFVAEEAALQKLKALLDERCAKLNGEIDHFNSENQTRYKDFLRFLFLTQSMREEYKRKSLPNDAGIAAAINILEAAQDAHLNHARPAPAVCKS